MCRLSSGTGCDDNEQGMSVESDSSAPPVVTSSFDVPMDAIVYDVHPAFQRAPAAGCEYNRDYPYGPPSAVLPPANSEPPPGPLRLISNAATALARTSESYFAALQSPPDFFVPKTFGMSAILGIMTA